MAKKVLQLEKLANKFAKEKEKEYPEIWWCFGNSDEVRILFYTCKWNKSENAKPAWKMNNDGVISEIKNI